MYCPKLDCPHNAQIEGGVYLLHIGCVAHNPFWDEVKSSVFVPDSDGDYQDTDVTVGLVRTGEATIAPIPVQHWEIGMLRKLPHEYREMWFPLMLLRATADADQTGRRVGALVELTGAREAGKTVIAFQAMDDDGYIDGTDDRRVVVNGFLFSRPVAQQTYNQFLTNLHLHTQHRFNRVGVNTPMGTLRSPGDLKATFVRPREMAVRGSRQPKPPSKLKNLSLFAGDTLRFVSDLFGSRAGGLKSKRKYWYTVVFYDAAGEDISINRRRPEWTAVDKLAVVIDGKELFDQNHRSEPSIEVALSRIEANSAGRGIPCCIVVTKLDLVAGTTDLVTKEALLKIANDFSGTAPEKQRQLLIEWLKKNRRGNRQRLLTMLLEDEQSIRAFKDELSQKGRLARTSVKPKLNVEEIFFIWTENLSDTPSDKSEQPRSHGLIQFICWCLGNTWDDMNRLSPVDGNEDR
ncbi:MAG: hypothetical protein QOE33_145 [Acidobacteriota bacterium]|nr:hypothetical protein [Acidobacteriota bacterium]